MRTEIARAAACWAACIATGWHAVAAAAPFVPRQDAEVVETLPSGLGDRGLRALRAALARDPGDLPTALLAARRLVEQARATGDPRHYGQAQAVLSRWWSGDEPDVLLLRATILQSRHEFDAAMADLSRLLARRPGDLQAWLTRATIEQVQGRYADALNSCERLRALGAGVAGEACVWETRSLSGDNRAAYAALEARARDEAFVRTANASTRAWVHALLAEMAERQAAGPDAERHHRAALALAPGVHARSAYADFLIDAGRPREALASLLAQPSGGAAPELRTMPDALLLRVALAQRAAGDPGARASAEAMRERFAAARLRGEALHGREEARFALSIDADAPRAARLAAENWRLQREPADARVALEAAVAARDARLLSEVASFVRARGMQDARLSRWLTQAAS